MVKPLLQIQAESVFVARGLPRKTASASMQEMWGRGLFVSTSTTRNKSKNWWWLCATTNLLIHLKNEV
jgi:hypothetical protein